MPELTLQVEASVTRRVLSSLELAFQNDPKRMKLTDYWEHHKRMIRIQPLGGNAVQLSGESGFYFPGHSYSNLDWLNTLEKSLFMAKLKTTSRGKAMAAISEVGLPPEFGYAWGPKHRSYDFLRSLYHAYSILDGWEKERIDPPEQPVFLEIGSGTGIQAYVFSLLFRNLTYVCIDLPETLSLSTFFLAKACPEKELVLYDEWMKEGRRFAPKPNQFIMLPHHEISKLPATSIDLIINTDSLQEMNLATIDFYFQEIRRLLKGNRMFYQSNRKQKKMGAERIEVANFPFVKADRHIFFKKNRFMSRLWVLKKYFGRFPFPKRIHPEHIHSLTQIA